MSSGNAHHAETVQRLWPEVTTSPELHFHSLDARREAGLFVQMPEGAYRAAGFLDGRSFDSQSVGCWIPLQSIMKTVLHGPLPAAPLHFIFHMGHTGSTLLSRLLDETGVVQPLREPLVLREWAELHDKRGKPDCLLGPEDIDACMEIMLRLWSRCRWAGQSAIVKATSTAARVGGTLMAAREKSHAVYLSMSAESWIALILAASPPLLDLRGHAEERIRRLVAHLGAAPKPLWSMTMGELAAASWLSEALTRERLKAAVGRRLLTLDFDEMLADITVALERVLTHFGLPNDSERVERLANSPVLERYSKAPEHAYSKELRQEVIEQSRQRHRAEIGNGMAFLADVTRRHPHLEELI